MIAKNDRPERERVYRYEVEILEIASGTSRRVPLQAFRLIPIPRRKGEEVPASREVLRFTDGDFAIEADTFEEFRKRLREQYPDELYERRLHVWRDREAEERRAKALEGLVEILVDAVAADFHKEGSLAAKEIT